MKNPYKKVITDDGSPTFSYLNKELMHHKKGAFLETVHTYLPILFDLSKFHLPFKLTNVGLGLAYIEILCMAYFIKYKIENTPFILYSYESNLFLKDSFQKYCHRKLESSEMLDIYDGIVFKSAQYFCISESSIKDLLKSVINNKIILKSSFTLKSVNNDTSHGVFFDAFSRKTTQELWHEDCLNNLLSFNISDKKCIFSSYAKNSLLKAALKKEGFIDIEKPGFQKRHCTYALRGLK